jgi:2-polyprenyl-3-methyl-5-hydroxy-6-metoxy-1,4-benzoquinol methylase
MGMATNTPALQPNPTAIFQAMNAFQVSFALKGALELDLFTQIAEGADTVPALAARVAASEKGVRVLCDFLTVTGFLVKQGAVYSLAPHSAAFLSKRSPAYMGAAIFFLTHDFQLDNFKDVASVVRKGGTLEGQGSLEPENPIWVEFARNMGVISAVGAVPMAALVAGDGPIKVLDIAAGSGFYGIEIAKRNPQATIYAQDWANVLELSSKHAREAGVAERFHTIAGSAFDVDLGSGYDLVLLPNFLHHFDVPTNVTLLRKLRKAMKPGSSVATVEFVPNEDRVSPPAPATFSLVMLTNTPGGDAYTFPELDGMFREAGFGASTRHDIAPSPETLIVTAY